MPVTASRCRTIIQTSIGLTCIAVVASLNTGSDHAITAGGIGATVGTRIGGNGIAVITRFNASA